MKKLKKTVVGLMSGTSADGVDAVVLEIENDGVDTEFEMLAGETYPYEDKLKKYIKEASGSGSPRDVAHLDFLLGKRFADSALKLIDETDKSPEDIDFIGSHGQTLLHSPEDGNELSPPATLQVGNVSVISHLTGITAVGDFRSADIAAGGEGAPLIPLIDYFLFRDEKKGRICLNIGGIANVTGLPAGCDSSDLIAFDTGPGNTLIDIAVEDFTDGKQLLDRGGNIASGGEIKSSLLENLMNTPFIKKSPPKSTGKDTFGKEFFEKLLEEYENLSSEDILATLTEFTAVSITRALRNFVFPKGEFKEIFISGGGRQNRYLMSRLGEHINDLEFRDPASMNVPSKFKEAIGFAILANETIEGSPGNIPSATGAKRAVVLGVISNGK